MSFLIESLKVRTTYAVGTGVEKRHLKGDVKKKSKHGVKKQNYNEMLFSLLHANLNIWGRAPA